MPLFHPVIPSRKLYRWELAITLALLVAVALLFTGPAFAHPGGKHCHPDQECHGGRR